MRVSLVFAAAAALAGLLAGGCEIDRHVTLELGPNSSTLTSGFTCMPLILNGYAQATETLAFNLVVDVIDVGDHVPSCLGEDVAVTCQSGACRLSRADAPTRFCQHVVVPDITSETTAPAQVTAYLHAHFPTVIQKAPDRVVIIRAVATLEDCSGIAPADAGGDADWPSLDPSQALGCAYSCPENLNDVDGDLSLGLNVLTGSNGPSCSELVQDCAALPATSGPTM